MSDCVFCNIVSGETPPPDGVIEYHEAVVFKPLNPVTPGHMLVIPIEHVAHAADNPYVAGRMMETAALYVRDYCDSANIITSINEAATQTIYHLHVHIVPRRFGDGLHLPWTAHRCCDGASS